MSARQQDQPILCTFEKDLLLQCGCFTNTIFALQLCFVDLHHINDHILQGEGHTDVVRFLHQRGASLTRVDRKDSPFVIVHVFLCLRNDKTIMHLAALNNREEVILLLLRAKGGEDLVNMNDQVRTSCQGVSV